MGARVVSFDYDADSVACTEFLRTEHAPEADWRVLQGSVLDPEFMANVGHFDVVYSWGVLHHTGDMEQAMSNAAQPVAGGGLLFVALYNDQGRWSRAWKRVKQAYVTGPRPLRAALLVGSAVLLWSPSLARGIRRGQPLQEWRGYESTRGMSKRHDLVDWVGGYPFEVATPGYVFHFYKERGFDLVRMVTRTGLGCNEFVFRRRETHER
jgi:2-polyprenyl-6-hydroxyphenyl methylase/3-demethylubiquinone-9 3-methyltransferase